MTDRQTHQSPGTTPPGAAAGPADATSRRAPAGGGDPVRDPRTPPGTEKRAGAHRPPRIHVRVRRRSHDRSMRPTGAGPGRLEYILLGLIALGIAVTLAMSIIDPSG
jgi:hypothetical protein